MIGDVMGRGLDAAAVMGQLRSASHALAKTGMPPWQLMRALDAVVSELPDQFVTCCYLVVDVDAAELTVCSAGHIPVLLAAPNGAVTRLAADVSVPLGVGEVPHHESRHTVEPGSVLALYTDGLVETPGGDIEEQLDCLALALAKTRVDIDGLEGIADCLLGEMLPDADDNADDVTLLLVHLPDAPVTSRSIVLPAEPRSVAEGRRFLRATLVVWGSADDQLCDTVCLLTSELLSNAVSHSHGPVRLRMRQVERELSVEVCDGSPVLPQARFASHDAESGRGLLLVDSLAEAWGTLPTSEGKAVWFSLPLPGTRR
ncbi:ATP-binding SpoIIE family protein phosphatase [Streptomyces goshikiensis]|uniref:ATP-binding SpoIIE family protein phosphatase n=1 Tax=Streptomyces goshikiensis TaxID=1942 RepID=UPI0033251A89